MSRSALTRAMVDLNLTNALSIIEKAFRNGSISNACLLVQKHDFCLTQSFGDHRRSVFLVASVSKPIAATGIMVLVDRGALSLSDPVRKFLPCFSGGDRNRVTVRHLLTHTSGLPDMLPENIALRTRHAPLKDFVAAICRTSLLFTPGTQVQYQSTGILLAATIVECITGTPFRDFLRREIFIPLGMTQTSLGLGGRSPEQVVMCKFNGGDEWNSSTNGDWGWNSVYWRDLGAPWAGIHSCAEDLARFMDDFLHPSGRILKPATAATMIVNQTAGLNDRWGLGWMVNPGTFGTACSPRTFGHYGVTGTIVWSDPETEVTCVLLTNKQVEHSRDGLLGGVSDLTAVWGKSNVSCCS